MGKYIGKSPWVAIFQFMKCNMKKKVKILMVHPFKIEAMEFGKSSCPWITGLDLIHNE